MPIRTADFRLVRRDGERLSHAAQNIAGREVGNSAQRFNRECRLALDYCAQSESLVRFCQSRRVERRQVVERVTHLGGAFSGPDGDGDGCCAGL